VARVRTTCAGVALTLLAISGCMGGGARSTPEGGAAGAGAGAHGAPTPAAVATGELRMRAIALYRSGVGFFEQGGEVDGDATTSITVPMGQIDDLLKSLIAEDAGGTVRGVDYDTPDRQGTGLASFEVDLSDDQPLEVILRTLRGAQVTVQVDGQAVSGAILGVDVYLSTTPGAAAVPRAWLTLLSGASARQVPLDAVARLHLEDAHLAQEMAKSLAALAARRGTQQSVALRWHGVGRRPVRFAYATTAPLWKASYRLILPPASGQGAQVAQLLGYAVVENETDVDWQGVRLDLMTGRPVSFIERLADPLRAPRPIVARDRAAVAPPPTDRGARFARARYRTPLLKGDEDRLAPEPEDQVVAKPGGPGGAITGHGVTSAAEGAAMGELFDFRVAAPVSIARGHAAMVPFLVGAVDCERVSIVDAQVLAGHPLAGALLANTTGGPMPQGPITVIDAGTYGGDASLGDVPTGEHRLISYSVDLPVRTQRTEVMSGRTLALATISGGVAHIKFLQRTVIRTEIQVSDSSPRTVILQERLPGDCTLVDTPAPFERVGTLARWRIQVHPGANAFAISHDRAVAEGEAAFSLDDADAATAMRFGADAELPAPIRDAFIHLRALRVQLEAASHNLALIAARRAHLVEDQAHLRDNIAAARRQGPIAEHGRDKLMAEDAEIERLDAQRRDQEAERDARRAALDAYVAGLDLR
jgi:hypothetical protein